jgi:hypothetical protein
MSTPSASLRLMPVVSLPMPLIEALIREPAAEPTLGESDRSLGSNETPVVCRITSTPKGVPTGR